MESSSRYPFGLLRATRCLWDSSMLCVIVFVYSHRCVVVHVQVLIIYYVTPLPIDIWVVSIFGPRQIVLLQTAFGCIFILFFFLARLISRSGVAKLSFCSYFQVVFQNDCTNLHFCQQCMLYILTNFI